MGQFHDWTIDELEYIRKNFTVLSYGEMAKVLKMNRSTVKSMAHRMGCWHTEEQYKKKKRKGGLIGLTYVEHRSQYEKVVGRIKKNFDLILKDHHDKKYKVLEEIRFLADNSVPPIPQTKSNNQL